MKASPLYCVAGLLAISIPCHTFANPTLAQDSGCLACHGEESQQIAPAFTEIAARYQANPDASSLLVVRVKQGSKGHWPESHDVPMPPYSPRLSDAEIHQLVSWILTQ